MKVIAVNNMFECPFMYTEVYQHEKILDVLLLYQNQKGLKNEKVLLRSLAPIYIQ